MADILEYFRQKIEKTKQEKLVDLNLNYNSYEWEFALTEIPPSILEMNWLESLYLANNKLIELPDSLKKLTNLTEFDLSYNQVKELPESIGELTNLIGINANGNQLNILPESLVNLTKLRWLDLDNNQLTALPESLGNLINLTELYLRNNQITTFPKSIKKLKNLKYLHISYNQNLDLSLLLSLENLILTVNYVELPRKYWLPIQEWRSQWILEEDNAEVRRLLIEVIGYEKICQELQAISIDTWREYSLLKIPLPQDDEEDIFLLTMKCPSTGYIHALRVPPVVSALEAITWVNWGINPEDFDVET